MHHVIDLKQTRGFKNVTLKAPKKFVGVAAHLELDATKKSFFIVFTHNGPIFLLGHVLY